MMMSWCVEEIDTGNGGTKALLNNAAALKTLIFMKNVEGTTPGLEYHYLRIHRPLVASP
jgi:hypothetical protein